MENNGVVQMMSNRLSWIISVQFGELFCLKTKILFKQAKKLSESSQNRALILSGDNIWIIKVDYVITAPNVNSRNEFKLPNFIEVNRITPKSFLYLNKAG